MRARLSLKERLITFRGKTKSIKQWAEDLNINPDILYTRRSLGWSVKDMLTTPVRQVSINKPDSNLCRINKADCSGDKFRKDLCKFHYNVNRWLSDAYGITIDDFHKLLAHQNGKCAICGVTENPDGRRLGVDHNHKTKAIRGLLCNKCNIGLEHFKERTDLLTKAICYLHIHEEPDS